MRDRVYLFAILLLLTAGPGAAQKTFPASELEFFENSIRPLFAEKCFECHGPEEQESELRLDHISSILKGGERGPAIVPGDVENSRLVEAVTYENSDLQMPPKVMLEDDEIDLFIEWVERGAPWPDEVLPAQQPSVKEFNLAERKASHWAWQAVKAVEPPAVKDEDWPATGADRFILARLESEGMRPAGEADLRTLIRRLYFDLIGLPPGPSEIRAYLNDASPGAYGRVIDRLLDSPQFGERWGRHWLDLVRFAESYGHEQDYPIREAWRYRDYVIRALNADVPYDELVREHIAGDQITPPRMNEEDGYNESVIGTGWWYMHQATHSPVDVDQDEADRIDNQIDVLSKAFMGMTVACARCHDHKFDAISTKDYYAMGAFIRASRQHFDYLDPHGEIASAVDELEEIHAKGSKELAKTLKNMSRPAGEDVEAFLLAAREVMHGEPSQADARYREAPYVFADFEDGYSEWTTEGAAFGEGPAAGTHENQNEVDGFLGEGLANSFLGGDDKLGKLTSPSFDIGHDYVHFLIGGGDHAGKTCINLLVDGKAARTATGTRRETLRWQTWEVDDLRGNSASIEIVDRQKGGWGHINVDHIVFSNDPIPTETQRPTQVVAREHSLNSTTLGRWVRATLASTGDSSSPLHSWTRFAGKVQSPVSLEEVDSDETILFESFDDPNFDGWFTTGEAFGDRPSAPGDWQAGGDGALVARGVAHSGLLAPELQGTLRSPSFTLNHNSIHFRLKGRKSQIRLIIGRYQLNEFNGILFGSTYVNPDSDEYYWHHMVGRLDNWKGSKAYIEIIDDGGGYIAVDEIRFSNTRPSVDGPAAVIRALLSGHGVDSAEKLAAAYGAWTTRSIAGWQADGLDADAADWLNFLRGEQLLDFKRYDARIASLRDRVAKATQDLPETVRVLAIMDGSVEDAFVFTRGNHGDRGAPVERTFLEAFGAPSAEGSGHARLQLAEWMTHDDNPFFARVMVNRIWHHLFGRGIVPSVDNFGVLGVPPSHAELLDYLALEFREGGYSIKSMIKNLLMTSTYRMTSAPTDADAEDRDPDNVLLHRASVKRLESEAIRDAILATAGTLNTELFGPSVTAYLSPTMTYHRRPGKSGPMDGDRRRTIYLEVKRNFLPEMQLAFDMPLPDSTVGRRTVSNVPAQSLILMNDPFVAEQAAAWGKRVSATELTMRERLSSMCERAWGRSPSTGEEAAMRSFLKQQGAEYGLTESEMQRDARVWSDLAQVLFMAAEFIFIG